MKQYIIPAIAILLATACNLTKDVDIDLPDYETQPVVECYLEPGKPFRLLLTRSYSFFDPFGLDSSFLDKTLLTGATVTIAYDNKTDTLREVLSFEFETRKIFNYTGQNTVPSTVGKNYTLNIVLADGKTITSSTTMLPQVPIDSIVTQWSADNERARTLMYITDEVDNRNFYRRFLHYKSLDSIPEQSFIFDDRTATEPKIAFGAGYDLKEGDTVFNSIFHISKQYFDYIESIELAVVGNLNPFAQPSPIKSNVSGTANALGIFTGLVSDRKMTIIEK